MHLEDPGVYTAVLLHAPRRGVAKCGQRAPGVCDGGGGGRYPLPKLFAGSQGMQNIDPGCENRVGRSVAAQKLLRRIMWPRPFRL